MTAPSSSMPEELHNDFTSFPYDEPPLSPGEEEFANRLYQHQRRCNHTSSSRIPKRTTRPPPRPRARQAEAPPPPSQENTQNSAHDAAYESYHESDDAEQGRLAVATGNITFNV